MQTTQLRSAVATLAVMANNDLAGLWRQVSTAVDARDALKDVLPALVGKYGAASATIAAEWYDDLRAKRGVKGGFTAIPADLGSASADALAGWAVGPLFAADPDWSAAKVLVAGGLQRRIADYSRATVTGSSIADPGAHGWERETNSGCAFCEMIASRGVVFSEASADFASHDHCQCTAAPAFIGESRPVKPYTPSLRGSTDADRARVREYLRTH